MKFSLQHIAKILRTKKPAIDIPIDTLLTDSRKLNNPASSLFFALDGPRRNGHLFIPELYKNGLRAFVISQPVNTTAYPDAVFIQVKDVLEALQKLAAHHRKQFKIDIIGITGSNGKTVVKEWLYQLLQPDKNIVRSPKSYNSQIGVPLSVLQMEQQNELAIFEAGISLPGEMAKLEKIIAPTIGILTNIGAAHSEGFTDNEEKLAEKIKLFKNCKIIIANGDDKFIKTQILKGGDKFFSWGPNSNNELQVMAIERQDTYTAIRLQYGSKKFDIEIPFTDNASVENAITCCAVLLYLKMSESVITARMKTLQAVNMRLEFKKGINNCVIINDSYSADMNSFLIALDFLQQQAKQHSKTVILSDFAEIKNKAVSFYTSVLQQLKNYNIERFIGIGPNMEAFMPELITQVNGILKHEFYLTTEEFIAHFHAVNFKDEAILVKGARAFEFEKIVNLLQQKQHQTILEINLDAIAHNYKMFQQLLKPSTKIMVMVKAFAYGSGGAEIAGVLQYHKADYLGVAYADEGVELRRAGITIPIMVMNPEENAFDAITDNYLEPDIYSFKLLHAFEKHLQQSGLSNYPVHIEVETGMNRLGFNVAAIKTLGENLRNSHTIKVQSVFSHLVASEDAAEDAFSLQQHALLQKASFELQGLLGYDFLRHIANSSAIIRLPQLQMDMVRLGIGLYGINEQNKDLDLKPVATLKSTIAQIKKLKNGDTVSYNRRGIAKNNTVIATVRIGYADGYSRRFSNGVGKMIVGNRLVPVIGSVCMDMTMIDVTTVPDVQEGDEVVVFGEKLPVHLLAASIGTIPYEIITGISQRVKRVYWSE